MPSPPPALASGARRAGPPLSGGRGRRITGLSAPPSSLGSAAGSAAAPVTPARVDIEPGLTLSGVEAAQRSLRAAHTQKTAELRLQELTLPLHARNPYAYAGAGRWTSTKVTTVVPAPAT